MPENPTTILPGERGEPVIIVRDHDGWAVQVAAAKRARADEEIAAKVAEIAADAAARAAAPPAFPGGREEAIAAIHAVRARAEAPQKAADEVDVTQALIEAEAAALPPDPPRPMRYGRPVSSAQLRYEADQAAWQAKQARPPGGGCGYCMVCRDGHPEWCLRG
jgi:hypothetical protein